MDSQPNNPPMQFSCLICRQRKVKCDRRDPCSNCSKTEIQCSFVAPVRGKRKKKPKPVHEGLHAKLRRYELMLERHGEKLDPPIQDEFSDVDASVGLGSGIQTPESSMSLDMAPQARTVPSPSTGSACDKNLSSRYSNITLWSNIGTDFKSSGDGVQNESSDPIDPIRENDGSLLELLEGRPSGNLSSVNLHELYPDIATLSQLQHIYADRINPIMKIFHLPSLFSTMETALASTSSVPRNAEALLLCFYLATVSSMSQDQCQAILGQYRVSAVRKYEKVAIQALTNARFVQSPDLVSLQALSLYLIGIKSLYSCRTLHALCGLAVRLSMHFGLHRDGANLGLPPFETELRRRLWWHTIQLDFRTSDLVGVRPSFDIFVGDTKPPSNVEDEDLNPGMTESPPERNDITSLALFRVHCDVIHLLRHFYLSSLSSHASGFDIISSAAVPTEEKNRIITQLEDTFESKYLRYCDPAEPFHIFVSIVTRSIICRMRVLTCSPKHFAKKQMPLPASEREIIFINASKLLQYAAIIRNNPNFHKYISRTSATYIWDSILYVLIAARHRPAGPEIERLWHLIGVLICHHHHHHQDTFNRATDAVYSALSKWIPEVWDEYAAAAKAQGLPSPVPPDYIVEMRASRDVARPELGSQREFAAADEMMTTAQPMETPQKDGIFLTAEEGFEFSDLDTFATDLNEWLQWERLLARDDPFDGGCLDLCRETYGQFSGLVDIRDTGNEAGKGISLLDAEKLGAPELKAINVSRLNIANPSRRPIAATSANVATILYTSGSSGTPKGIVLKHEGFRNWLESTAQVYGLESEVVLQQSSMGFDMSLIQVFTAVCLRGSMYVVPRRLRGDAQAISELVHSQEITYTFTCTSELFTWFKYGSAELLSRSQWRRAITDGEPGVDALFKEFASLSKPELRMFHAYGPTEISWTTTTMELLYSDLKDESHQNIAVGYPLPNYSVYVLDNYLNPVPPGVQGEIFVGGPGVAEGYLNNDAMTAQRFVPDVFATPETRRRGWNTLHRTGDLGRWSENGALFVEGRISGDTQVKIRGLRVDLREVEKALVEASQSALSEAVVSVRRFSLDSPQFLAAHVVFDQSYPHDDRAQILDSLTSRLRLPRYMCPSVVVPLDHMPMTNSLKLDRRAIAALPLPEITNLQDVQLSETESQLKCRWQDVISSKIIGLHNIEPATDFFHVGGTSLLLLDLRRRIQMKFHIQLSLIDMFNGSTLAGMALMVESKNSQQPSVTQINWVQETDLPAELQRLPAVQPITNSGPKTIVLTGSTGYLGRGILNALLKDPDVKAIHCIAVRNKNSLRDIEDSDKVTIHEGDLILPRLGLSDRSSKEIFDAADAIIHNGADVSYMKSYASLRLPNVQATKQLAKMSMHRMIPFHYISSGGACSFAAAAGSQTIGPASVAQFPPPTSGQLGYASSKWASEVFLEKLKNRYTDWPVYIHRPSNIARIDTPHLDLVYNIRKYSRLLRAAPIARGKVLGSLDSVRLDTVVQGILAAMNGKTQRNIQFLHHLGGVELPINDLGSWISKGRCTDDTDLEEAQIEEIAFEQWNARAAEKGMHPALVAFMQTFAVQGGLVFPNLVK